MSSLAGEIVSFKTRLCGRLTVGRVRDALAAAGFDPTLAQERTPQSAFRAAIRKLADKGIVREIPGDVPGQIRFQLTREWLDEHGWEYERDDVFTLDLATGCVMAEQATPEKCAALRDAYLAEIPIRDRTYVVRLIKRIFSLHGADLYLINAEVGGHWLVPFDQPTKREFVARVEQFVTAIGGTMERFPVPRGDQRGDGSLRDAIRRGIEDRVRELADIVAAWDSKKRRDAVEAMTEKFRVERLKCEAYADLLADAKASVEQAVSDAEAAMLAKVESMCGGDAE